MRIGLLSPSIYMSPSRYGDMIFAPRDLSVFLANGLVKRGHDVTFFTAPDIQTHARLVGGDRQLLEKQYQEEKLEHAGGERQKWASFYTVKRNYELDLTTRAYQMAKEGKLDIVHSYHDSLAHFFDELTGFPTVYTLHDPVPKNPNSLPFWLLNRFKKHNFIAISKSFGRLDGIGLNFVGTVYHGIDLPQIKGVSPGLYLACAGRMVPEKGIHLALDAARTAGLPIKVATSVMKENQNSEYFNGIVKPYTRDVRVEFVPFMKNAQKTEFLASARAFLFPIVWEEPFGMVMIEAMACGTPVIAYNRGSVSEVVRDGFTGFIIDPDSENRPGKGSWIIKKQGIEGLVEAIGKIDQIDRAACRKHVEENFTVAKMVEGYENVYEKVRLRISSRV